MKFYIVKTVFLDNPNRGDDYKFFRNPIEAFELYCEQRRLILINEAEQEKDFIVSSEIFECSGDAEPNISNIKNIISDSKLLFAAFQGSQYEIEIARQGRQINDFLAKLRGYGSAQDKDKHEKVLNKLKNSNLNSK